MTPLLALALFSLLFTVFGRIVFACIPAFRPTALNTLIFVIGAFAGAIAAVFVDDRFHPMRYASHPMFFLVPLLGAPIGGTLAVWIRTRYTTQETS